MISFQSILSSMYGGAVTAACSTLNTIKAWINPFNYFNLDLSPKPNYSRILPGLYLTNAEAAANRPILHNLDISHVLTINDSRLPASTFQGTCISNLFIKASDRPSTNLLPYFPMTNAFIEEGIETGNVIVHCQFGISRSATLVIAYVMQKYQMSFSQGLSFVRRRRQIVNPNPGFCEQLKDYERSKYNVGRCASAMAHAGQHKYKCLAIAVLLLLWLTGTYEYYH